MNVYVTLLEELCSMFVVAVGSKGFRFLDCPDFSYLLLTLGSLPTPPQ